MGAAGHRPRRFGLGRPQLKVASRENRAALSGAPALWSAAGRAIARYDALELAAKYAERTVDPGDASVAKRCRGWRSATA